MYNVPLLLTHKSACVMSKLTKKMFNWKWKKNLNSKLKRKTVVSLNSLYNRNINELRKFEYNVLKWK